MSIFEDPDHVQSNGDPTRQRPPALLSKPGMSPSHDHPMVFVLHLFCAVSFIGYGVSCLASGHMAREFERYGLARYRVLTGALQLMGAVGLLAGFHFPLIGALAAGGLALQMLLGFCLRLKIGDRFLLAVPALANMVLCVWLCARFLR